LFFKLFACGCLVGIEGGAREGRYRFGSCFRCCCCAGCWGGGGIGDFGGGEFVEDVWWRGLGYVRTRGKGKQTVEVVEVIFFGIAGFLVGDC
jgi:hypothetical protein